MKKLIIRLLSIMLLLYGIGLASQLYATKPSKKELPPPAEREQPAELDKDKYRAVEPTPQAPPDLRGDGGCFGCNKYAMEIPVKPEVEAKAKTEEQVTEKTEEQTPGKPPKKGQVYTAIGHGVAGMVGTR